MLSLYTQAILEPIRMIYQQAPPPPTSICIQHFVALQCNHEPITHKTQIQQCTPMTLHDKMRTTSLTDVLCTQEENALFL